MTVSPPRGPQGRRRPAPLRAVVVRTAQLTPRLTRVTVTGEDFDRFRWPGPAGHFKLMLPEPGAADVNLPEADSSGTVVFTGTAMPTMRTYTASHFRADTYELDIDVVLHGDGPAAAWALQARPGGRLAVTVPRSAGFTEDPTADWVLLAGDASALPAQGGRQRRRGRHGKRLRGAGTVGAAPALPVEDKRRCQAAGQRRGNYRLFNAFRGCRGGNRRLPGAVACYWRDRWWTGRVAVRWQRPARCLGAGCGRHGYAARDGG